MEEGQTGNEIVTGLWREGASLQRLEWEMLKGFVFPSAGTRGEPSRTDPQQSYSSEKDPLAEWTLSLAAEGQPTQPVQPSASPVALKIRKKVNLEI